MGGGGKILIVSTICCIMMVVYQLYEYMGISLLQKIFGRAPSNIIYSSSVFILLFLLSQISLNNRLVSFIGKNTLGIYLLQGPVYKALEAYIPEIISLGFIYPLLVLVLCSCLCWIMNRIKVLHFLISI